MPFTWRELWSRKNEERYDNLKFAVSGGVVLWDGLPYFGQSLVINGQRSQKLWAFYTPLCCWNGDPVFHSGYHDDSPMLYRHRNGEIQTLKLKSPMRNISGAALNDGGLLLYDYCNCTLVRDTSDGEMEIVQTHWGFDTHDASEAVPWSNGILYHDLDEDSLEREIVFYAPTPRNKTLSFLGLDYDDTAVVFSDGKHACVVSRKKGELREWDAHGRERVFPVAKGSALSRVVRPGGTCRGRAFLLTSDVDFFKGPFKSFVYMGNGRLNVGPPGWGQWAAYGDRAYRLCDGTLTCFEALETTASLLELCASRAAAVEYTERQLGALPVELRELLIS